MKKINVLIVEDETVIALDIENSIIEMKFNVISYVSTYEEVQKVLKSKVPDIILMDIHLEDSIDGIEIVKKLKESYQIPIIYLTAYTDELTISRAIETEPIGYIVKPFNREELKATILLGLYKLEKEKYFSNNYVQIGDSYYFDMKNKQLFYDNIHIKLSKRERTLLILLLEAKGNIITHIDLEREIWEETVTNNALRTLLFRLRSKLDHKLIESVPSLGYRILLNK